MEKSYGAHAVLACIGMASDPETPSNRDKLLAALTTEIENLQDVIATTDPETLEEKRLQNQRRHELGYLANQYRKLQKDTDLDEMHKELLAVKGDNGVDG